jgi:AcrR family transcriptional regulator
MPRKPDVALEGKIVDVAYRLWSDHGEKALTMRAVARAARTTTPTLYQRFRDKKDLRHFLEERARQNLFDALQSARTSLEICRKALEFTSTHGHEYRLLAAEWGQRFAQRLPTRAFDYLKKMLAKELGGEAAQYEELAMQLFCQVHGAALLRPEEKEVQTAEFMNEACLRACSILLEQAASRKSSRIKSKPS